MLKCKNCGRQTGEKPFCEFCGYPIDEDSDEIFVRNRKNSKENSTIIVAVSVLLFIGTAAFVYYAFFC